MFCGFLVLGFAVMRKSEYSDYSDYSEYSETRPPESPALAGVLCIIKSKSTAESSSDSAKVRTKKRCMKQRHAPL